jgi:hypothetical protein
LVYTKRHNVIAKKTKKWSFDSIKIVLDGNDRQSMKLFQLKEMTRLPEKFEARTIVYDMISEIGFSDNEINEKHD